MRSGYVIPNYSYLYYVGRVGFYWSGRANSSSFAYSLYFGSSDVDPSIGTRARLYGLSVRCVAGWE